MNRTSKMLLMTATGNRSRNSDRMGGRGRNRADYGQNNYDHNAYNNYDMMEDKLHDRRGREHYDNGRYAPMNDSGMWVESRRGRDSRGRYTSVRNHYDDSEYYHDGDEYMAENYYPYISPYVPPVYNNYNSDMRMDHGGYMNYNRGMESRYNDRSERAMNRVMNTNQPRNKIGFSIDGEMDRIENHIGTDYHSSADYQDMDEMSYRHGDKSNGYGHSSASGGVMMDKEMAREWLDSMENVDGTKGPHWTMEQTKKVMAQKGIQCDPVLFDLTMNMMYSDYSKVAKKLGVNSIDFYACMAEAFLKDPDSVDPKEKLGNYYEYIVKK